MHATQPTQLRFLAHLVLALPAVADGGEPPAPLFTASRFALEHVDEVESADWNGDGLDDFAAVHPGGVALYLSAEYGYVEPFGSILDGEVVADVAAGHLNDDGNVDLVATSTDTNRVLIAHGNGDGTFGAPLVLNVPGGPDRVIVGDFNLDGNVDVVTTTVQDFGLAVIRGQGGGAFFPPHLVPIGDEPVDVDHADFDGNGSQDFAIATNLGQVWIALGGHTGFEVSHAQSVQSYADCIAAGDFNGDGRADVVVGGFELWISTGNGFGSLFPPFPHSVLLPAHPIDRVYDIVRAELDGDGVDDIVATHGGVSSSAYYALGLLTRPTGVFETYAQIHTGDFALDVALGDVDGNGELDFALAVDDHVRIVRGDGDGGYSGVQLADVWGKLLHVDLDGDGVEELFAAADYENGMSEIWVLDPQPDGSYPIVYDDAFAANIKDIALGDAEGDGDQDVYMLSGSGFELGIFLNHGDGTYDPHLKRSLPGLGYDRFLVSDVDQDGDADVVVPSDFPDDELVVVGNVDLEFVEIAVESSPPRPHAIVGADFDGDGDDDIALSSLTVDLLTVRFNEAGVLSSPTLIEVASDDAELAVGDVDGDGHLDLIALADELEVLFGVGDGTFEEPVQLPGVWNGGALHVADLDGDSVDDIITDGTAYVRGSPERVFAAPVAFPDPTGGIVEGVAVVDVDGDGRNDVLRTVSYPFFFVSPEPDGLHLEVNRAPDPTSLSASVAELSLSAGGVQELELCAGPAFVGELYVLLGSISGTSPGIDLGSVVLPLNFDAYFMLTFGNPDATFLENSFGILEAGGVASASVVVPAATNPAFAGLQLEHAYVVADAIAPSFVMASNPVSLTLVP